MFVGGRVFVGVSCWWGFRIFSRACLWGLHVAGSFVFLEVLFFGWVSCWSGSCVVEFFGDGRGVAFLGRLGLWSCWWRFCLNGALFFAGVSCWWGLRVVGASFLKWAV